MLYAPFTENSGSLRALEGLGAQPGEHDKEGLLSAQAPPLGLLRRQLGWAAVEICRCFKPGGLLSL